MNNIRPINDLILIEPINNNMEAGILIPDEARFCYEKGKVLAVGPGKRNKRGILVPTTLKPGQTAFLPKHEGIKIKHNNQSLEMFFEKDILAIQSQSPGGFTPPETKKTKTTTEERRRVQ